MANVIITSSADSFLIEIDGKKASFQSGDVHPYTPDGSGDTVYLYETKGILKNLGRSVSVNDPNLSKDRIPLTIGTDTIDVNGTTVFTDADDLLEALRVVFFLARPDSPLIPEGQRVNTFADLPDPVLNDGDYYVVDIATGTWILGTKREAGIYKAVAGAWVYRGADVPYYLLDDQFTIKDSIDNSKQLGFEVGGVSPATRRIATWQDKDGTVALVAPNIVPVTDLSDFPSPVGGFIPLVDNTIYDIHGIVDIGANGLDWGTGRFIKMQGSFASTDTILSSKTGDFIIGTSVNINILQLTLVNNDCTVFLNASGAGTQIFIVKACIFIGTGKIATLNSFGIFIFQEWLLQNFTNGIEFTGNSVAALIRATQFVNCTGILIDLNAATFDTFEIDSMVAAVPAGTTAIKVAANGANINTDGEGIITSTNINASGGGNATDGYSPLDLAWNVYGNSISIITSDRITPTGFGFYQDAATTPATQLITTTPQKMQIDGAGSQTETSFLPKVIRGGLGELWDVVDDKITPITEGDSYDVGIDLEVTAKSGAVTEIIVTVDIGGAATITIPIITADAFVGKTPPFTKRVNLLMFSLATFITNGGQIFLATDAGTVTLGVRQITISRNSSGAS